jgi:hypothetical protein
MIENFAPATHRNINKTTARYFLIIVLLKKNYKCHALATHQNPDISGLLSKYMNNKLMRSMSLKVPDAK